MAATGEGWRAVYSIDRAGFVVGWLHAALSRRGWLGALAIVVAVYALMAIWQQRGTLMRLGGLTWPPATTPALSHARGKVLLSLASLGLGAVLAGTGALATWTATTSAGNTMAAGTVLVALGNTGASTNRLTVNASGLVPGDTVQRSFDLANTGSQDLSSLAVTTTASPSSLLDTDTTHGLQMVVDRCSVAWTESGSSPAFTYSCSGSTTTIVTSRPVIQTALAMSGLSALTAGGTDHLRLTLTFPSSAGSTFQGLSSTFTYSFLGTQRAGTAH